MLNLIKIFHVEVWYNYFLSERIFFFFCFTCIYEEVAEEGEIERERERESREKSKTYW
jgi:hypothetical protein